MININSYKSGIPCYNKALAQNTVQTSFKSAVNRDNDSFVKTNSCESAETNKALSKTKMLALVGILSALSPSCAKDEFLGEKEPVIEVADNPYLIANTNDSIPDKYPLYVEADENDENVLHIFNTDTNEKDCTLDLNKLVEASDSVRKNTMIKNIKTLSPIVLQDMYNEVGEKGITDERTNHIFSGYYGYYEPKSDKIEWRVLDKPVIYHEMGHAIAHSLYNNNNVFMPEFSNEFVETFTKENEDFINTTGRERRIRVLDSDDIVLNKGDDAYKKAAAEEFFADYYEYLNNPETGKTYYRDGDGYKLEWDFFPNATKLVRKYINHVRSEGMESNRKK